MIKKEQLPFYMSPEVKTIEIKTSAIICQSGNIDGFTPQEDDPDNWL